MMAGRPCRRCCLGSGAVPAGGVEPVPSTVRFRGQDPVSSLHQTCRFAVSAKGREQRLTAAGARRVCLEEAEAIAGELGRWTEPPRSTRVRRALVGRSLIEWDHLATGDAVARPSLVAHKRRKLELAAGAPSRRGNHGSPGAAYNDKQRREDDRRASRAFLPGLRRSVADQTTGLQQRIPGAPRPRPAHRARPAWMHLLPAASRIGSTCDSLPCILP